MKEQKRTYADNFFVWLRVLFAVSICIVGTYYELESAILSSALMIWLVYKRRKGPLVINLNDASIAIGAVALFYIISCFWAEDSGMALWGAVKYLPLPLFGLCLMQFQNRERQVILGDLPWLAAGMTILSFLLQFVSVWNEKGIFSVNGRLAGFFQYPNTFACFVLIGLLILLMKKKDKFSRQEIACGIVLVFGLLMAGSRTIYVLAVIGLIVVVLFQKSKAVGICMGVSLAAGGLLAVITEILIQWGSLNRLTEIAINASTFLGRLLYWKDAVPVILQHPMGLGYLGYHITQSSFQTGVYSVRWVHNDFLQLLLDIGWIPAILAVIAVVKALLSKKISILQKTVLMVLLLHCMMDFDLEFIALYFILLLCLDWEDMKQHKFFPAILPSAMICLGLGLLSLYVGVVSTLTYMGYNDVAAKIYPWNTQANVELLTQIEDIQEKERLADQILKQNDSISMAWDVKAQASYSKGDFASMIKYKKQAITLSPYTLEKYVDYFTMLRVGVDLYLENGDSDSAAVCQKEIAAIQDMLDMVIDQTDPLAWRIQDQPELTMPKEYQDYMYTIRE